MIPPAVQAWKGKAITLDTGITILISKVMEFTSLDHQWYAVVSGVSFDVLCREFLIKETGEVQDDDGKTLGFSDELNRF